MLGLLVLDLSSRERIAKVGKGQEVWELRSSVEEMTIENWIQRVIIFSEMYLTKFNIYTNELNDIIKIPSIELVHR